MPISSYLKTGLKRDPAGGTFALPSSGGHPGLGVNVLLFLH